MTLSAVLILVAADSLSACVDITESGRSFGTDGVARPGFFGSAWRPICCQTVRKSSSDAWHSLRMRGGLRQAGYAGRSCCLITILANAIRHSEEIVLAAEARAFSPEHSRAAPIRIGRLDWWLIPLGVLSLAGIILIV